TPGQTRPQKPWLLRESLHRVSKPRAFKRGLFRDKAFWDTAVRSALKPAQRAADFFADAFGQDLSIKDQ
ncbi:MAG: hypothetical protein KIC91_08790, partial [Sutterella sp.]|nr:hypothetical protein [Sutterella sp.]